MPECEITEKMKTVITSAIALLPFPPDFGELLILDSNGPTI